MTADCHFIFHIHIHRLMQMLWTWCRRRVEKLSSLLDQLLLLDASSAPKLWAQTRDATLHTSTSIQRVVTCAHTHTHTHNCYSSPQTHSNKFNLNLQHIDKNNIHLNTSGLESVQVLHYAPLWFLMLSQTHITYMLYMYTFSHCVNIDTAHLNHCE